MSIFGILSELQVYQLRQFIWNILYAHVIWFICLFLLIIVRYIIEYVDNLVNQFLMTIVKVCLCFQFPNQSFTLLNLLNKIQRFPGWGTLLPSNPSLGDISSFKDSNFSLSICSGFVSAQSSASSISLYLEAAPFTTNLFHICSIKDEQN